MLPWSIYKKSKTSLLSFVFIKCMQRGGSFFTLLISGYKKRKEIEMKRIYKKSPSYHNLIFKKKISWDVTSGFKSVHSSFIWLKWHSCGKKKTILKASKPTLIRVRVREGTMWKQLNFQNLYSHIKVQEKTPRQFRTAIPYLQNLDFNNQLFTLYRDLHRKTKSVKKTGQKHSMGT